MRVLVCGGREYADRYEVDTTLHALHQEHGIELLIHGAARGADRLGAEWAEYAGVPTLSVPANWDRHGRAAGPIRNALMLELGKPDLVVAFPGGTGTADMVAKATAAGVRVVQRQLP